MLKYFLSLVLLSLSLFANNVDLNLSKKEINEKLDKVKEINNNNKTSNSSFTYWYYKPDEFGARAFHTPLQFIVEGGMPGGKNLTKFDLANGMTEVFKRIINPIKYVNDYGWGRFIYYEFIPHKGEGGAWIPNYTWHLWGGGFRTRLMIEYFHYNNYKYPALWGWATMYIMHFFNESTQMASFNKLSDNSVVAGTANDVVDPISDLFFFDWVGGLLFSYDPINRFVTKNFHLSEWSYQSQLNPITKRLLNNGQLYWMRYQLGNSPFSINALSGSQINGLGLSYEWRKNHYLSWNYGATLGSVIKNENGDLLPDSILVTIGFSYSISDNPIVVATVSQPDYRAMEHSPEERNRFNTRFRINLYPGLINFLGTTWGLSFAYQRETFFLGITNGNSPIGLVFGHQIPEYYNR